jgi:phosphatidylethanolamine/phosphatidyl-N-methylethanolamine N-methyltransferase
MQARKVPDAPGSGRTSLDIRAIEQAYRRYAGFYDVCFGAVFQPGRRAIVDRMDCGPGERILEVGVGTGLSLPLYPEYVSVVGIDISRHMLAQARVRQVRCGLANVAELMVMDAENMDFRDDSFDKVVAMYVASVVPDPERLVDEMRRVCKPGGQIFMVNHFHSRNPILGGVERLLAPLSKQLGFRPNFSLDRFLGQTGLDAMNIRPVNLFDFSTLVEARNNKQCAAASAVPAFAPS